MPSSFPANQIHAPRPRVGLLQVSIAGVLWGTGGLAVVVVRRHDPLSPLTISGYRTAIAALVLLVAAVLLGRGRDIARLLADHPARTVALGLLTAAYQALYFTAVVAAGVAVSTVVSLGLAPVLLAVADAVRRRRLPGWAAVTPVAAALCGLVLVSTAAGAGANTGHHPVLGLFAALASGSAYAVATALGGAVARHSDPLVLTASTTTIGALVLAPITLIVLAIGGGTAVPHDPATMTVLVYLGAVTMALAYILLYAGLRTTSGSAAVVATLLEPVTAAITATVVLGERLGILGAVGAVLILGAVASVGRRPIATA